MLHVRICAGGVGQPTSLPRHMDGLPTSQELDGAVVSGSTKSKAQQHECEECK
jgi:hypothetical protein